MARTNAKEAPTTATSERVGTASSRPLGSGPQTTQLAVPRRLSRGLRRELPPNKQFLHASGRRSPWSLPARTPACNKSSNSGGPAVHLVATGKNFGQQLPFYTSDSRRSLLNLASRQHAFTACLLYTTKIRSIVTGDNTASDRRKPLSDRP